jgi:hypothetical protein
MTLVRLDLTAIPYISFIFSKQIQITGNKDLVGRLFRTTGFIVYHPGKPGLRYIQSQRIGPVFTFYGDRFTGLILPILAAGRKYYNNCSKEQDTDKKLFHFQKFKNVGQFMWLNHKCHFDPDMDREEI